jgi:cyclopropane fatty-acyl-phospholipid synthase-like methyltransferase
VAIPRVNDKYKIIEHYDVASPYYYSLWGEHLHHGYWVRGDESKETAQIQLIEHLAQLANIKTGSRILDIGCGFGGSSLYLTKKYDASTTGITISPVQVEMAKEAAAKANLDVSFLLMDAEDMQFVLRFGGEASQARRMLRPHGLVPKRKSFDRRQKEICRANRERHDGRTPWNE